MCDYSLVSFRNRLAVKGEQLQVHQFPGGTLGLISVRRSLKERLFPGCTLAVCVPPGARLLLRDIPERVQQQLNVDSFGLATFVQQSAEPFVHRDAVRFENGREILLQRLERGQRVDVLSLSSGEGFPAPSEGPRMREEQSVLV
ncbi:MAG TPA: hypothetical protein VN841_02875 [Bryobacteraceae bacterium]|nr:hypothetical protein [Bryobacteraceae bacterium]